MYLRYLKPLTFAAGTCVSVTAAALPPDLSEPHQSSFRLFLGTLDGSENRTHLNNDTQRYTLGLGASEPVAWDGRIEANLEAWVSERGYRIALSPSSSDSAVTFTSAALGYGLRLNASVKALRPYASGGVGFQYSELRADNVAGTVKERVATPVGHIGFGLEWRVGRDLFSIDYRRSYAEAEFSDFQIGGMKVGGEFLGIGLGTRW